MTLVGLREIGRFLWSNDFVSFMGILFILYFMNSILNLVWIVKSYSSVLSGSGMLRDFNFMP